MIFSTFIYLLQIVSIASAFPSLHKKRQTTSHVRRNGWNSGAVNEFTLHESCNATEANQLHFAFEETTTLATHARDHVLRFGNESAVYQKYFGGYPPFEVIGAFSMIIHGDKQGLIFRCDDPDGNCAATDYAGHWRGENASMETVICARSFEERRELSQVCALGYNVAESSRLIFWASDMMHRYFHLPTIGYGYIEHYADGYREIVTASDNGVEEITHDSDALQYFALEAWAHDIAVPGEGCPGPSLEDLPMTEEAEETSSSSSMMASETSMASSMASSMATPTQEEAEESASATAEATEAAEDCHTHDDGSVHCI